MKPTIGRIVHYTHEVDIISPAIITEIDDRVSLHVFMTNGSAGLNDVEFTEAPAGTEAAVGKWAWPAREG